MYSIELKQVSVSVYQTTIRTAANAPLLSASHSPLSTADSSSPLHESHALLTLTGVEYLVCPMFCVDCTYVCVYVCMYVCMYVCTYVCVYVCMYVCVYVICMYVCTYVYMCMYVCMYVRMCVYVCNNNNNMYLLQLGCLPVAVVILHVNKT